MRSLYMVEDAGRLSEQADKAQIKPSKSVMQQTADQVVGSSNLPGRAMYFKNLAQTRRRAD